MEAKIQSVHFKATEELQEFIQGKVDKLSRINDKFISVDVYLKLDNSNTHDNKVCEMRISIPGHELFAERQCKTFEEAASLVTDALHDQLMKRKG